MANLQISPSLICMDLCNIEAEVRSLEAIGCQMLHVDVIDGRFSPDMPLGINMIRQLREKTGMVLDAHGKKMSKSKGNVINPMDLVARFGSDAFRLGILRGRSAGMNQAFSENSVIAGRNLCNKLWNNLQGICN